MKLNKYYSALAMAVLANGAHAHAPTTTHDITIRIGGASAQDSNLEALIYNDLCEADANRDRYSFNNANNAYRAISCTTKSSGVTGLPAAKTLLVIKRSAGGSGFGVQPLVFDQAVDFMKVSSGCTQPSTVSGYTWNCTETESVKADAGISDVNPELFIGKNVPAPFTQDVVSTSTLEVRSVAGLSFGLAVSKNLRDELQRQLIAAGKLPNTCTAGDETAPCMPSFSKHLAASILGGSVTSWEQVSIDGTSSIATAPGAVAPTDTSIKICRREDGSGTQATANEVILHYPCSASAGIAPASTISNPRVVENSAAGNLDTCLSDSANWVFGFQSTERNAGRTLDYRFIKMDGVEPTIRNIWNGKNVFWSEATIQWKKTLTADPAAVMNVIATNVSNVARTAARNAAFSHSWGDAGYVALVSNGNTALQSWNASQPITAYQHNIGGKVNNCQVPTLDSASTGTIE
jgi:hypothetical protein